MTNTKGFAVVEGFLILVIAAILGGTGWYVWNAHNKATDSLTDADSANSSVQVYSKNNQTNADPTASWKTYSSAVGKFSIKYPSSWVTGTNQENCDGYLMLGPDQSSAGHCQSDATPQVSVVSMEGDKRTDNELNSENYDSYKKTDVVVASVAGVEYSGTLNKDNPIGAGKGDKIVKYLFYANGRTYVCTYSQSAAEKDVLDQFKLMVTKTLKFSS